MGGRGPRGSLRAGVNHFGAAGGAVQSTGGKSMDLPAGPNTIKVAMVRDPNDLFVVLIQAAAPPPAAAK